MTAVFLAPHYDDVALSCGGTVAALAAAPGPPPLVATIFGGAPAPGDLTAFARWQHERWGTDGGDTVAARLAEERAAADALGCAARSLPFLDAIYRGDHYLSDDALFGPVHPADAPLLDALVAAVAALPGLADAGAALYVPLAIGNHVDHQLAYGAGRVLAARGIPVLAYEDVPYALLGEARARRLAALAGQLGEPALVPIGATLPRRLAAIGAYRSQLPTIFRFTADWAGAVADWARAVGGAVGPAERFWPLLPPERR